MKPMELIYSVISGFTPQHHSNISKMADLCGALLSADLVMYNQLTGEQTRTLCLYSPDKNYEHIEFDWCQLRHSISEKNPEENIIIEDIAKSPLLKGAEVITDNGFISFVGHPVRSGGNLLGAICVYYKRHYVPSRDDLTHLALIGAFISNEDMNSREEKAKEINDIKSRYLLEASAEASRVLISNLNYEEAVNKVLEITSEALSQDRVYICELTETADNPEINQMFALVKGGISQRVNLQKKENFISDDLLKIISPTIKKGQYVCSAKFNDDLKDVLAKEGIASLLAVPVFVNNSCWGFAGFENFSTPHQWNESEISVIENIISSLGQFFLRHYQRLELILAKAQTEESEIYANSLFDQSPLSIIYVSVNGLIEKVNKAFESHFYYSGDNVAGQFNFLTNEISRRLKWDEFFKSALNSNLKLFHDLTFDPSIFGIEGKPRVFNIHSFPIRFKGKVKKIALVLQDITDKSLNESLLKIQRNLAYSILRCKTLNEFLSVVISEVSTVIDLTTLYTALLDNRREFFTVTGYGKELDNMHICPLNDSLEGYAFRGGRSMRLTREEIYSLCEKGIISYPGNIPAVWLGVPFTGSNNIRGVLAVASQDNPRAVSASDIEIVELIVNEIKIYLEKKAAEENSVKLTKAMTENPASVLITDRMGNIEYVNPKFTNVTGYTLQEVLGLNPSILKSGDTPDHIYKNLWETITSGKEWRGELKNRKKSGEFFWEDISISPIFDDNGYISHYVAVKEDITDRKILISELISARDKAQESDRLKSSFIQNISHEIRTPMNGIMGFIDLLRDSTLLQSERQQYLDTVEKCGIRMLKTINDLIDISKIEAGIVKVNNTRFQVDQVLLDLVNFFTPEAEKNGLTISLKPESVQNLTICSDQEKIYASLSNLIKNAIKFSTQGNITIGAELRGDYISFSVKDTGIGIPEDKQETIFDRFIRVESENPKSFEGAGLGLSIVKGYIELLGGSVEVQSQPGKGSEFSFSVPVNSDATPDCKSTLLQQVSDEEKNIDRGSLTKLLIVEDEETNRLYLRTLLKKSKFELFTAENGAEAVDIFTNNRDIKIILMDIRMPVMDGYEATRRIREIDKDVIIIAQTAYASSGDRERIINNGCNEYIQKPIRKGELMEMIDRFLPE
jgi:PAS domain S-box-containing protein